MLFGAGAGRLVGVQPPSIAGGAEDRQPKRVTLLEPGQVPLLGYGRCGDALRSAARRLPTALQPCSPAGPWPHALAVQRPRPLAGSWPRAPADRKLRHAPHVQGQPRQGSIQLGTRRSVARAATTSWPRANTKPLCTRPRAAPRRAAWRSSSPAGLTRARSSRTEPKHAVDATVAVQRAGVWSTGAMAPLLGIADAWAGRCGRDDLPSRLRGQVLLEPQYIEVAEVEQHGPARLPACSQGPTWPRPQRGSRPTKGDPAAATTALG